MIIESRKKTPIIKFNDRDVVKSINVNDKITVWVDGLYNENELYNFSLVSNGCTVVKISNLEYALTATTVGIFKVRISVVFNRTFKLYSNELVLSIK